MRCWTKCGPVTVDGRWTSRCVHVRRDTSRTLAIVPCVYFTTEDILPVLHQQPQSRLHPSGTFGAGRTVRGDLLTMLYDGDAGIAGGGANPNASPARRNAGAVNNKRHLRPWKNTRINYSQAG